MSSSQGWLESDDDYRERLQREADERTIENATGDAPSQGWLESDSDYRDRISREANERTIESNTGDAPSQGWLESDSDYRERIDREANESTVERYSGKAPSQGWLESDDDYQSRVAKEAHERTIEDSGGRASQGWLEGDYEYRSRVADTANDINRRRRGTTRNDGSSGSTSSGDSSGGSYESSSYRGSATGSSSGSSGLGSSLAWLLGIGVLMYGGWMMLARSCDGSTSGRQAQQPIPARPQRSQQNEQASQPPRQAESPFGRHIGKYAAFLCYFVNERPEDSTALMTFAHEYALRFRKQELSQQNEFTRTRFLQSALYRLESDARDSVDFEKVYRYSTTAVIPTYDFATSTFDVKLVKQKTVEVFWQELGTRYYPLKIYMMNADEFHGITIPRVEAERLAAALPRRGIGRVARLMIYYKILNYPQDRFVYQPKDYEKSRFVCAHVQRVDIYPDEAGTYSAPLWSISSSQPIESYLEPIVTEPATGKDEQFATEPEVVRLMTSWDSARYFEQEGLRLLNEGRYADAKDFLNMSSTILPDSPELLRSLGLYHAYMGRRDESLQYLNMAYERQPGMLGLRDIIQLVYQLGPNDVLMNPNLNRRRQK